ncbi:MAG: cytochrome c [Amphiplicatus sp.]
MKGGIGAAAAGLLLALSAVNAASADDVVGQRQALMKEIGKHMKEAGGLASGQTAWDAAQAKALTGAVAENAKTALTLFPESSAGDPESHASAKIWQDKADFDKRLTDLAAMAAAAGAASTVEEFQAAFKPLGGTCKSCHDIYREKKE